MPFTPFSCTLNRGRLTMSKVAGGSVIQPPERSTPSADVRAALSRALRKAGADSPHLLLQDALEGRSGQLPIGAVAHWNIDVVREDREGQPSFGLGRNSDSPKVAGR